MKDRQLLIAVLAQLEREKTVSIPQLAHLLDMPEERVFDALETLVFAYDAASIRLDLHDTYASLEMHGKERLMRLTAPEADALLDALASAGFAADDELVQAIMQTKSMLAEHAGSDSPRMHVVSEAALPDIAQAVAAACEDDGRHLLEIAYRGQDDVAAQLRRIEPMQIFSQEGHRYVQAFCHEAQGWRSFRIDRIIQARTLDECFIPRKDVPPAAIELKQAGLAARVLLEADCPTPHWKGLRITQTRADGSRIGAIPWTGSSWLPRHIVALMGKAVALDPPELANACRKLAHDLLADLPAGE